MDEEYLKRSVFREFLKQQHGFNNKRKLQKSTKSERIALKNSSNFIDFCFISLKIRWL